MLFETAKEVCKSIGVYYQDYANVVDTYISDWSNKGYEKDALCFISNYCFKQSIRTLEGMNVIVLKFFKLGLVSLDSIQQYIMTIIENDEKIKLVLETLGLVRSVSSFDRDMFKIWIDDWNYSFEQILKVAEFAHNKFANISYMNKMLSSMNNLKLKTNEEIQKYLAGINNSKNEFIQGKPAGQDIISHNYSQEQLSAVYDSLDNVEI